MTAGFDNDDTVQEEESGASSAVLVCRLTLMTDLGAPTLPAAVQKTSMRGVLVSFC